MVTFSNNTFSTLLVFLVCSSQVLGHGTITGVAGANGVQAAGFGIIASTPRDGTTRRPFQQDTSIIRDIEINSGQTGACGRTLAGGNNDVASQLSAAATAGLPTTSTTGELSMTLHQVNGDGAGPYTCDVSTDGGATFTAAAVTTNVPGRNGRSRARATDFPLVMQVSPTTACKGGPDGNACIARCRNPAQAGPFGSCVAFMMNNGTSTTNNTETASSTVANTITEATSTASSETANSTATVETVTAETAADTTTAVGTAATAATVAEGAVATEAPEANSAANAVAGNPEGDIADEEDEEDTDDVSPSGAVNTQQAKRFINSRIVGRMAGQWLEA